MPAASSRPSTAAEPRFAFGANWRSFLAEVDEDGVAEAIDALRRTVGQDALRARSLVDIGCGSGLSSLAALRLGAARVQSLDYDPDSVSAALELKRRFAPDADQWTLERGDVLDRQYMRRLGPFDVVMSWGVLHHTGAMWSALANACDAVVPGGTLFVALYNDQGRASRQWARVKRRYVVSPAWVRRLMLWTIGAYFACSSAVGRTLGGARPPRGRGMSSHHDLADWVGGHPFEVAKPEEVFRFCRDRGFRLSELTTCAGGLGCNEYVFIRDGIDHS
jgi:2-polyprenyl-6-hydroxyphenyl methylase/3-demethylubiquinone-9 3-methyltransferase